MLVFTRKIGETVAIGNEIKVKILEIRGNQVRLGIEAPKEITIHREEVFLKIQKENKFAANNAPKSLDQIISFWKKVNLNDEKEK